MLFLIGVLLGFGICLRIKKHKQIGGLKVFPVVPGTHGQNLQHIADVSKEAVRTACKICKQTGVFYLTNSPLKEGEVGIYVAQDVDTENREVNALLSSLQQRLEDLR